MTALNDVSIRVALLDKAIFETTIEKKTTGTELFDSVCKDIRLESEQEFFGLRYATTPKQKWINFKKPVLKQLGPDIRELSFQVRFYPPDPTILNEQSRYLFYLQLRSDVTSGKIPCINATINELGSYSLQTEIGDWEERLEKDYVWKQELSPIPLSEKQVKVIIGLHKSNRGMTVAEAESNYLELAKRLAFYGMELFDCLYLHETRQLGICAGGIILYDERLRLSRFPWSNILSVVYQKSTFTVKLKQSSLKNNAAVFKMPSSAMAKAAWKSCIENHKFFRLVSADPNPKKKKSKVNTYNSNTMYSLHKAGTLGRSSGNTLRNRRSATLDDRVLQKKKASPLTSSKSDYGGYIIQNGDEPYMNGDCKENYKPAPQTFDEKVYQTQSPMMRELSEKLSPKKATGLNGVSVEEDDDDEDDEIVQRTYSTLDDNVKIRTASVVENQTTTPEGSP